jgi:hypothetical protein
MADWQVVFRDDLEKGEFYDQGATEVTLPRGYRVAWKGVRPEMDFKDTKKGQPEVHLGRYSGVGFHVHTAFQWWMVSNPIDVAPGKAARAKAALMIVSHGIGGDDSRAGACGMRIGLVNAGDVRVKADDLTLSSAEATELARPINWEEESKRVAAEIENADADIAWSKWWVVRNNLDHERQWKIEQTEGMAPRGRQVRLIIQCNADVAAAISAGHYDDLIVEQDVEDVPPANRELLLEVAAALREQADILTQLAG